MHLNNITKGILPLIFIVGLFKITGIEAAGNQKGSGDSKQNIDSYDYSGEEPDESNGDISAPKSTIKPYFESNLVTVYATKDVENITLECSPINFNDSSHSILWYNDENTITNGNTSLSNKYAVDNKFRLTVLNYNKNMTGNFSCVVFPTNIRQYVAIEFSAPPENITDQNGAATTTLVEIGFILTSLLVIMYLN